MVKRHHNLPNHSVKPVLRHCTLAAGFSSRSASPGTSMKARPPKLGSSHLPARHTSGGQTDEVDPASPGAMSAQSYIHGKAVAYFNYTGLKAGDCSHDRQTDILPFQYSRSAEVCSRRLDNGGASSRVELPRLLGRQANQTESGAFLSTVARNSQPK